MADVRECGLRGVETAFGAESWPALSHGIVAVKCDGGEMGALISHSDEYIGYDSACQHIAAAARTPTLTIFAGTNNKNFIRRWSACGDTDCRIVHVNTLTDPAHVDINEVIARIMRERALRAAEPKRLPVRGVRVGHTSDEPTRETMRK
jgi:hypothetical protein